MIITITIKEFGYILSIKMERKYPRLVSGIVRILTDIFVLKQYVRLLSMFPLINFSIFRSPGCAFPLALFRLNLFSKVLSTGMKLMFRKMSTLLIDCHRPSLVAMPRFPQVSLNVFGSHNNHNNNTLNSCAEFMRLDVFYMSTSLSCFLVYDQTL